MEEKKQTPEDTAQEKKPENAPEDEAETTPAENPSAETPQPEDGEASPEEPENDASPEKPLGRRERRAMEAELKKLRAENTALKDSAAKAESEAAQTKDKYLRTLAEYDNYRKRTARERDGIYADAASECVKELLPLIDNLERAAQYTESDRMAEGVKMILGTVPDVMAKMNIEAFGAPGDTFDPALHNAVMHVDDEQYGEGEILEVFQRGYRHGDKIIRYAMVKVAN